MVVWPTRGRSHADGSRTPSSSDRGLAGTVCTSPSVLGEARSCIREACWSPTSTQRRHGRCRCIWGSSGRERAHARRAAGGDARGIVRQLRRGRRPERAPGRPGPSSLAGLASDCWAAVGEGDGATFPSHAPTARIDYLFAGPSDPAAPRVDRRRTASDHLMVVGGARDRRERGGRGERPGFRKSWIAMNTPKRVTATTRNDSSPRKNHSRNPLIASTSASYRRVSEERFGRVARCASGCSPVEAIAPV